MGAYRTAPAVWCRLVVLFLVCLSFIARIERAYAQEEGAESGTNSGRLHPEKPGDETPSMLPGKEVRVLLSKVIPDIDRYLAILVEHVEDLKITPVKGRTRVELFLFPQSFTIELQPESEAKEGQIYEVRLKQKTSFELSMHRDSLIIDRIQGFTAHLNLPVVPDGVSLRKLRLDTSTEMLTIWASAVGGTVRVVAKADVRMRRFEGVDWVHTLLRNFPLFMGGAVFRVL
ncbi:MAG: hypothetical protein AB1540_06825 [Bdellovibrionota bacterium]